MVFSDFSTAVFDSKVALYQRVTHIVDKKFTQFSTFGSVIPSEAEGSPYFTFGKQFAKH